MKIHAKQTPPEWQESPLFYAGCFPEEVEVFGNNSFNRHTSDTFDNLPRILDDIAEEYDYLQRGLKQFTDFQTILEAFTGRDNYTRAQRKQWADILKRWTETDDENGVFCDSLRLITGKEYKTAIIRGSVQSEWQYIIYPAEYSREWLDGFEREYFNTGTEWEVSEDPDDRDDTFIIYCVTDDPRAEIAKTCNTTPDNVILFEFDGWNRAPKYKEVKQ